LPFVENESVVEIPETSFNMTAEQHHSLQTLIDPLGNSDSFGMDIYLEVCSFICHL
jgi:hypothetical protein